ncbi:MAG: hypothetical protein WBW53_05435 [Terriglobales bacterium]
MTDVTNPSDYGASVLLRRKFLVDYDTVASDIETLEQKPVSLSDSCVQPLGHFTDDAVAEGPLLERSGQRGLSSGRELAN